VKQFVQRGSGGPLPENIQGQVGQGSEHPVWVEDVPAHCRGVWGRWPLKVPFSPTHSVILWFYDSLSVPFPGAGWWGFTAQKQLVCRVPWLPRFVPRERWVPVLPGVTSSCLCESAASLKQQSTLVLGTQTPKFSKLEVIWKLGHKTFCSLLCTLRNCCFFERLVFWGDLATFKYVWHYWIF